MKAIDSLDFETLVREYSGRMLSVARRYLHSEVDVQDCLQDAYIQAFRGLDKFEGRSSIETWLHRIVINTALMKLRSSGRSKVTLMEDTPSLFDNNGKRLVTEAEVSFSTEDVLVNQQTRKRVRDTINALPENLRNLLMLRDIEGYNVKETAELLNISEGAVKTGLHRARGALKLKLAHLYQESIL